MGKPRPRPEDLLNYRQVPAHYTEQLRIKRYSPNIVRTYTDLFEKFIPAGNRNYYYSHDPKEITEKEILAYLRYLVDERQVCVSYQNQAGPRRLSMPGMECHQVLLRAGIEGKKKVLFYRKAQKRTALTRDYLNR